MSHSIDKVNIQIPGTMYHLQLAADRGRWILSLLLRGDAENEVIVPVFSKNSINKAANELLNNSRLVIDKYPLKNVCDQLFAEAERSLPITTPVPEEVVDSEDLDEIKQKIDLLENTIENVNEELKESINGISQRLESLENERVARLESEIVKNDDKGEEELISNINDRLDKIEESLAATKGDDRVPSILTAIEALEGKISQLEGKTITTRTIGGEIVEDTVDMIGIKEELSKLSRAFDLINQRLTYCESKLSKTTESKPPVIEGAPDPKSPTEM
ncbi:MAG: hypothetical protein HZR80_15690 [Candidatus Heimdallarchaeota archaeon]